MPKGHKKNGGYPLNLHAGKNAIIMAMVSDGEKHAGGECFPTMRAAGYSTNGIYGTFKRLQRHEILASYKGMWWLTPKGKKLWEQAPRENAA
jgi:predicted Zn-dependent protease